MNKIIVEVLNGVVVSVYSTDDEFHVSILDRDSDEPDRISMLEEEIENMNEIY